MRNYKFTLFLELPAPYRVCMGTDVVYDECNRRCECNYGYISNCKRVRKEFNSISLTEKKLYIETFVKLTTDPVFKPRYDEFINLHSK